MVAEAACLVAILGVIAPVAGWRPDTGSTAAIAGGNGCRCLAAASDLFGTYFTNGALDNGPLPGKTGPAAGDIRKFAREIARVYGFVDG